MTDWIQPLGLILTQVTGGGASGMSCDEIHFLIQCDKSNQQRRNYLVIIII
jgi:hypothetical protein